MNNLCNSFDVVYSSEDVGSVRTSDELRLIAHKLSKHIRLNLGVLLILRLIPSNDQLAFRRHLEGAHHFNVQFRSAAS